MHCVEGVLPVVEHGRQSKKVSDVSDECFDVFLLQKRQMKPSRQRRSSTALESAFSSTLGKVYKNCLK